jgi:hypothetical protein
MALSPTSYTIISELSINIETHNKRMKYNECPGCHNHNHPVTYNTSSKQNWCEVCQEKWVYIQFEEYINREMHNIRWKKH